eukprot:gene16762-23035_t
MINTYDELSAGCQRELGRALHMALFIWRDSPDIILTKDCDEDIKNICLTRRPNMASTLGAVGECLGKMAERGDERRLGEAGEDEEEEEETEEDEEEEETEEEEVAGSAGSKRTFGPRARLSEKCYALVNIAEPPSQKKSFDASLSFAMLKNQLDKIDATTRNSPVRRESVAGNARGISLTGWMATLGMASLVLVVLFAAFTFYKRIQGQGDGDPMGSAQIE